MRPSMRRTWDPIPRRHARGAENGASDPCPATCGPRPVGWRGTFRGHQPPHPLPSARSTFARQRPDCGRGGIAGHVLRPGHFVGMLQVPFPHQPAKIAGGQARREQRFQSRPQNPRSCTPVLRAAGIGLRQLRKRRSHAAITADRHRVKRNWIREADHHHCHSRSWNCSPTYKKCSSAMPRVGASGRGRPQSSAAARRSSPQNTVFAELETPGRPEPARGDRAACVTSCRCSA